MNPNNLVRPSILNTSAPPPPHNQSNNNPSSSNSLNQSGINMNQLLEQIKAMINETLAREATTIIQRAMNQGIDEGDETDQIIESNTDRNLAELDKIPDIVKSLRDFSGQPGEFSSWKKSVDRILNIYEHMKGTAKYYGILSVIRNKIIGQADVVLESYNTPLNWQKIAKCLTIHYADKRDLGTLEYQMTTLIQGNKTIQEFYHEVYQHLSLILNKLSCMEMGNESLNIMTQSYRDKALDTFVRGLRGDLPRLLSIREPVDLPQALHLCLKLQNVDYRTQYANNSQGAIKRNNVPPPLPPRDVRPIPAPRTYHNTKPLPAPKRFFPELLNLPQRSPQQNFQRTQQQNQYQIAGNNPPPKPQPRPEPMDVDRSIHTRQINYSNRPNIQNNNYKRPLQPQSQQIHAPNKQQRIFNVEPEVEGHQECENEQNDQQTLEEYIEAVDNPNFDATEELEDIYFLD